MVASKLADMQLTVATAAGLNIDEHLRLVRAMPDRPGISVNAFTIAALTGRWRRLAAGGAQPLSVWLEFGAQSVGACDASYCPRAEWTAVFGTNAFFAGFPNGNWLLRVARKYRLPMQVVRYVSAPA